MWTENNKSGDSAEMWNSPLNFIYSFLERTCSVEHSKRVQENWKNDFTMNSCCLLNWSFKNSKFMNFLYFLTFAFATHKLWRMFNVNIIHTPKSVCLNGSSCWQGNHKKLNERNLSQTDFRPQSSSVPTCNQFFVHSDYGISRYKKFCCTTKTVAQIKSISNLKG